MTNLDPRVIDMTPDGRIIDPPKPSLGTIFLRLAAFGVFLCIAAIMFWTALFLLPFLLLAGVIGYFALRSQIRRGGITTFTFRR